MKMKLARQMAQQAEHVHLQHIEADRPRKVHFRNIRLFVNAGMDFPECYSYAPMLDTEKSSLPTSPRRKEVTCARCLKMLSH